jgi:multiple sugar transport system substrate-binding protein
MPITFGTRTRALVAATTAATLIVLAGCSNADSGSQAASGPPKVVLMNWEALDGSPLEPVLKQFTADTGIQVEYQFAASGSDYWPKTRAVLGSNNPPDVMRIDDDFLPYYASTGKLQDLRDDISSAGMKAGDYYDAVYNSTVQQDGSIPAWSLGIQPRVIFYNKTMFKEAGVPTPPSTWSGKGWTWDDFVKAAQKLTVKNKRWGADVVDDSAFETLYTVNNGGEGRWTKDGKGFALADPPGQEAVQWVADLTCKHGVQPAWSELSQSGRGAEMFAAGQIGMIERASSFVDYFRSNAKGFDWDIAPVPAGPADQITQGNQLVFAIPKAAANKDAAWKLLQYLTTAKGADQFAKAGAFVPGLKSSAQLAGKPTAGKPPASIPLVLDAADHSFRSGRVENIEEAIGIYRPALDPVKNCQAKASDVLPKVKPDVVSTINP